MPEGDTIWRAAGRLDDRLAGRVLERAAPAVLSRLVGRRLVAVEPAGKHLFMRFEGGLALHSHMRMTGAWHLYTRDQAWRRPRHLATAVLGFGDIDAVLFAAPVLEIVADDRGTVRHLGPDIMCRDWDLEVVIGRARGSPAATVGELLLDQRVCAGIGNIHRCDALWSEGVDPWLSPAEVDDDTLRRLYRRARVRMRLGAVGGRAGLAATRVHGRGGRPCPRCGTTIAVRALGEQARLTYWCPRCQRANSGPS